MELSLAHGVGIRAVAFGAVALAVAGCGDDGDDDGTRTTRTEPEATATTQATAPGTDPARTDDDADDVDWTTTATDFRGRDGDRIGFDCPPGGELATVWGTGTYTDDSSVCSAAVHNALISVDEGGRVVIEITAGQDGYEGSERDGVVSLDFGEWPGSFRFPADQPAADADRVPTPDDDAGDGDAGDDLNVDPDLNPNDGDDPPDGGDDSGGLGDANDRDDEPDGG